jgi:NAD+ kinase
MRFGITSNLHIAGTKEMAKKIIGFLDNDFEISIENDLAKELGMRGVSLEDMNVDILITIGGDGTILRALQHSKGKILGINAGDLGFLTEINSKDVAASLERIIKKDYTTEKRIKLKAVLNDERLCDCTNEAVIHTAQIAKMRHFEVLIDGRVAEDIRADGIIVATPTGSTCYALSVGAPIIDPRVHAFVVVPIAPFKLSARPIVVPAQSEITIKLKKPRKCILVLDGQHDIEMSGDDVINFTISEFPAEFIRFDKDFYARIKEKLII